MPVWEYKVTSRPSDNLLTEEQLNKLGEAGLELISVVTAAYEETVIGKVEQNIRFYYFFKKPKGK